ncbi:hypothetical protein [Spirosoma fluminis]
MTVDRSDLHSFNWVLACEIGVEKAIIVGNFQFWISGNEARKSEAHYRKGEYWTYTTAADLAAKYPYLKAPSIYRWLKELKEDGWIKTDNFNEHPLDKKTWYGRGKRLIEWLSAPNYQTDKSSSQTDKSNYQSDNSDYQNDNSSSQTDKSDYQNDNSPIYKDTDIETDNNTDIYPESEDEKNALANADESISDSDLPAEVPSSNPRSAAPLSSPEPVAEPTGEEPYHEADSIDAVEAERLEFTKMLQGERRLIEGLSRSQQIRGEEALDWIEQFVTTQWSIDRLKNRSVSDLRDHCQKWIKIQLEIKKDREQREANRQLSRPGGGQRNQPTDSRYGAAHADRFGSADYATAFGLVDAYAQASGLNGRQDSDSDDSTQQF